MKTIKFTISILVILVILSPIFSSCGRRSKTIREPQKEIQETKIKANIYIENSGSMKGYCNYKDTGALETLLDDYIERLNSEDKVDSTAFYLINTAPIRVNTSKEKFLRSIKSKCTAQYTKLDDMLSMMMDNIEDDSVNILVSDCVFTTPTGNLATASSSISTLFSNKLKVKNFAVAITKYIVNFNGQYYPGGLNCKKPLPLYVWVFGNKDNVQTIINLPLNSENCGTYFLQKSASPQYSIEAKNKRMISGNDVIVNEWEKERRLDYYELPIKVRLSDLLITEEDILNKTQYEVKANNSTEYFIHDVIAMGSGDYKLILRTKKGNPSPGEIEIKYPITTPNWVEASNYEGKGIPSDNTTYGISYLINGVSKAYRDQAKNQFNYFTIKIKLKGK